MDPPHQRFRAGHAVAPQAVLGLEIHDELALLQRGLHGGGDRLFPQKAAAHGIVINGVSAIVLPLDAVHRQHRPVAHLLHRQGTVHDGIDAPLGGHVAGHFHAPGAVSSKEPLPVLLLLLALLQAEEPVRTIPPADPLRANALPQLSGNLLQQTVAVLGAVHIVVQLEVLDVGTDDGVVPVRVFFQPFPHLAVEKFPAVQPGETVKLELVHHGGGLPQLDEAGHPVQNDLRPVRLGHKVGGAVGQRSHFVFLAVPLCGHNDRDERPFRVLLHMMQEGVPVHHRHHHIQQDERDLPAALLQHRQRLLTVFGLQRLVGFR